MAKPAIQCRMMDAKSDFFPDKTVYSGFSVIVSSIYRSFRSGDFFLVDSKVLGLQACPCLCELKLLYVDKVTGEKVAQFLLYFTPEQTREGRQSDHGEHEVICADEVTTTTFEKLCLSVIEVPDFSNGLIKDCRPASLYETSSEEVITGDIVYDDEHLVFKTFAIFTKEIYDCMRQLLPNLNPNKEGFKEKVHEVSAGLSARLPDCLKTILYIFYSRTSLAGNSNAMKAKARSARGKGRRRNQCPKPTTPSAVVIEDVSDESNTSPPRTVRTPKATRKKFCKSQTKETIDDPDYKNASVDSKRNIASLIKAFEKYTPPKITSKERKPKPSGGETINIIPESKVYLERGNEVIPPVQQVGNISTDSANGDTLYLACDPTMPGPSGTRRGPSMAPFYTRKTETPGTETDSKEAKPGRRKNSKPMKVCVEKTEEEKEAQKRMPPKKRYELEELQPEADVAGVLSLISQQQPHTTTSDVSSTTTCMISRQTSDVSSVRYPICSDMGDNSNRYQVQRPAEPVNSDFFKNLTSFVLNPPPIRTIDSAQGCYATSCRASAETVTTMSYHVSPHVDTTSDISCHTGTSEMSYCSMTAPAQIMTYPEHLYPEYIQPGNEQELLYERDQFRREENVRPPPEVPEFSKDFQDLNAILAVLKNESKKNSESRPSVILHTEQIQTSPPPPEPAPPHPPLQPTNFSEVMQHGFPELWPEAEMQPVAMDSPCFAAASASQSEKTHTKQFYDPETKTLHEVDLGKVSSVTLPPPDMQPPKKRIATKRLMELAAKRELEEQNSVVASDINASRPERKMPPPKSHAPRGRASKSGKMTSQSATSCGKGKERQTMVSPGPSAHAERDNGFKSTQSEKTKANISIPLVLSSPYISSLSRSVHMTFRNNAASTDSLQSTRRSQSGKPLDLSLKHRDGERTFQYSGDHCLDLSVRRKIPSTSNAAEYRHRNDLSRPPPLLAINGDGFVAYEEENGYPSPPLHLFSPTLTTTPPSPFSPSSSSSSPSPSSINRRRQMEFHGREAHGYSPYHDLHLNPPPPLLPVSPATVAMIAQGHMPYVGPPPGIPIKGAEMSNNGVPAEYRFRTASQMARMWPPMMPPPPPPPPPPQPPGIIRAPFNPTDHNHHIRHPMNRAFPESQNPVQRPEGS